MEKLDLLSISSSVMTPSLTKMTCQSACSACIISHVVSHMSLNISANGRDAKAPFRCKQYDNVVWNNPVVSVHAAVIQRLSRLCAYARCRHDPSCSNDECV